MKDCKESKKPVYCYQCAQKGHYGHVGSLNYFWRARRAAKTSG